MLQMVRTLAHFSTSLEEMNEHGENAGGGGEKDGGEDLFRNKKNGTTRVNLDRNGLCVGSPNGEVWLVFSCLCVTLRPPP